VQTRSTYGVVVLCVAMVVACGGALSAPADAVSVVPTCNGQTATIVGTDSDDTLTGTAGDDVVSLGPGNDSFGGDTGNDTVCGGPGDDSIRGNKGVDHLFGEDGNDHIDGGNEGTYEDDVVDGMAGDDTITGESGTYLGGAGADSYLSPDEGGQNLTVRLGSGADVADIDNLFLATFYGDEGRDVFSVPDPYLGDDTDRTIAHVDGGPGRNRLSFAESHNKVRILVNHATALWGQGTITFRFLDEFVGSERADTLVGSGLTDDHLFGVGGNDALRGLAGDDHLVGGSGSDTAYGGRGNDTCEAEKRHYC
jgi:Ca2+-binding RTX toxin-like protein